ncbi:hypothetical protein PSTT_06548 [Puccinia striiformis]|uniref:Uncharacterized protein n=1 Tax=Puccinia striiformis TaxID=27350 RepID=A0A2S4VJR5_9BASI|nr:hypothetical protein PSTT_06548 [Puccinia striiformis]
MRSYKGREGNLSSSKAALQKAENRDNANTGLSPAVCLANAISYMPYRGKTTSWQYTPYDEEFR